VPGGQTMKMSGTSMASPNVCNLAAKLLAMDPSLKPAQVMQIIEKGCEAHADDPKLLVVHPVLSAKLLKK